MGSPFRVESVSVLDRNEVSSSTFLVFGWSLRDGVTLSGRFCFGSRLERRLFAHLPWWLVPILRDGVTRFGSCCAFLHTRSERRLLPFIYPSLLRDGVTLRVVCVFLTLDRNEAYFGWLIGIPSGWDPPIGSGSGDLISNEGITTVGLLGAVFPASPRGVLVSSFGRPVCSVAGVGSTFCCLRFWRGLCVWPSSQRRSGSWPFFFWPCCLSPSPGDWSASAAWQVMLFTWAFPCVGLPRIGGLLAALPEVWLLGLSCWCHFRVPQILCLTSLPRVWS